MTTAWTSFTLFRWACFYARRFPAQLFAAVLLMGASVLLGALKPWPTVFLIDYVLQAYAMPSWLADLLRFVPGADNRVHLVGWSVAASIAIFLLNWICGLALQYANVTLGQRVTLEVTADLLQHLQRLSLRFHSRRPTGDSILRVTGDCGSATVLLRDALLPILTSLASLVVMFSIMWHINHALTLLALLVAPWMWLVFRLYARPMLERNTRRQDAEGRIYSVLEQTLSAMPVVQGFGREELNETLFRRVTAETLVASVSSLRIDLQFKILIGLATALGTAGILWFGAKAAANGEITVGEIILFLSYLASLYAPLESIVYTGSTIQGAGASARRVLDIMATAPEICERGGAAALGRVRGAIRFEHVGFAYEPGRPILRDVSLDIGPGQTVALVGPTGAGKSTLVSLIPRFFDPSEGRVLIDGHDLRDVQLASLRGQVALVLQEPFLFPLTVAENIAYGRPGASRAEIEAAARAANAHEFIARLPQGYDTVLGERGTTLSGGERQRLSISRALLKDAPILILDEPTSALDAGTEALIMEALRALIRGRTTLIIAHRLSTVRHADRIVVLHEGSIVESGSHNQLIQKNGQYARFADLQLLPS